MDNKYCWTPFECMQKASAKLIDGKKYKAINALEGTEEYSLGFCQIHEKPFNY